MSTNFVLGPLQTAWVKFLRENPHLQFHGRLGAVVDGEERYCCLGAGAKICGCESKRTKIRGYDEYQEIIAFSYNSTFEPLLLPLPVVELLKLRYKTGELKETHRKGKRKYNSLTAMNDKGMTWPEIADYIEKNPENVFTGPA